MAVPPTRIHISPKILHLAGRRSAVGRAACMLLPTTFALATFAQATKQPVLDASALYQLGPNDTVLVHVKDESEIPDGPYVVDLQGQLTIPELGTVRRPGGFVLSEKNNLSVMQALSLAEGAERTAGLNHARVLRRSAPGAKSTDIPIDLSKLIAGKSPDFDLQASDILVVPTSAAKSAMFRTLEAAVNTGSGVAIYHPF